MKKLLSLILVLVFVSSTVPAFAAANAQSVQNILVSVKSKIDIPEVLTEFSSSSDTESGKTVYTFRWTDKDYNSSLEVCADSDGLIKRYYSYGFKNNDDASKISSVTKDEVLAYSDSFIKKLAPERFTDENDCLLRDEKNISSNIYNGTASYYISYNRVRNGTKVMGANNAYVDISVNGTEIRVTNSHINWDSDTEFEDGNFTLENPEKVYTDTFPIELAYQKNYRTYSNPKQEPSINLVYRLKDGIGGYISAETGEKVEEDINLRYEELGGGSADKVENSMSVAEPLTPQESEEINNIKDLLTPTEILSKLKKISALKIAGSMKVLSTSVRKSDTDDEYYRSLYIGNQNTNVKNYRLLRAEVNAKTGEIISINNYSDYSDKKLTDAQKKKALKDIDAILQTLCKDKIAQCEETTAEDNFYRTAASKSFLRLVNGIKYLDNSINISYDAISGTLLSFYMDWDKNIENMPDASKAISAEDAYKIILEKYKVEPVYVLSDGKFKPCYSISDCWNILLDAVTKEFLNESVSSDLGKYTDIDGHWCADAVKTLSDVGIALKGNEFKPDENITQEDLFRLLGAGLKHTYYLNQDTDELYNNLYSDKILTKDERSENSFVSREDAFVYFIRLINLEKAAKLSKIYKNDFADSNLLSPEKTGYAAILSGLGIISGEGMEIYPTEKITRAEAAMMLYRYMK